MKIFKTTLVLIILGFSSMISAQNETASKETKEDKMSYYEKRALEDAKYEQQFQADNKAEEETFWEEQKSYEKELKRKDRKAYMKGKRDAYAEHYDHCHHSEHYYHHATFYYYGLIVISMIDIPVQMT